MDCGTLNLASTPNAATKYGVYICERLNGETGRGRNIDFAEAIGFLANVRHLGFPSAGLSAERVVAIARLKACHRRLSRRKVKRSGKVLPRFIVSSFDCGKCFGGVCAADHISPNGTLWVGRCSYTEQLQRHYKPESRNSVLSFCGEPGIRQKLSTTFLQVQIDRSFPRAKM
jgi:ribosomal protein S27AE